jgi:pimeloyl-ACP methyl ester carboxylesterase
VAVANSSIVRATHTPRATQWEPSEDLGIRQGCTCVDHDRLCTRDAGTTRVVYAPWLRARHRRTLRVASRSRLPSTSALYRADPLPIRGVVNLSGTPDMTAELPSLPAACGETVVRTMLGGTPQSVPERYAQSSASAMLPLGVPQALIWGARDDQVPLAVAERYPRAARSAGDRVRLVVDSAAGHFETASPRAATWPAVRSAIRSLLDGTMTP